MTQELHPFNPNEFTEKELVKLIYRDLTKLQTDFDEFVKNNTVQTQINEIRTELHSVRAEVQLQKELREQSDKKNKALLGFGMFFIVLLELILKFVFKHD